MRARGRMLELGGDSLIGTGHGVGAVPGASVGISLGVRCLCEGAVHTLSPFGSGRVVGGGAHKRMRERDAAGNLEQPGVHRRSGCRHVEPERLGGTVQQHGVAQRLGRCPEDEELRLGREQLEPARIALFDLADERMTRGDTESAGELCSVPGAR
jgi:hypothetical protein